MKKGGRNSNLGKYKSEDVSKRNGSLRYASSNVDLTKKIKTNVDTSGDTLYWYLRFNLPLDPQSVGEDTMQVIDLNGYILKTEISYLPGTNVIKILPIDDYEKGCYYVLNISGNVKSEAGNPLKEKVDVLFKLSTDGRVEMFDIIDKDVKVPKPKPRPANYEYKVPKAKVTALNKELYDAIPQDKLPSDRLPVNPLILVLAVMAILPAIIFKIFLLIIVGLVVSFICIGIMFKQLAEPKNLSVLHYNIGAMRFNSGKYKKANESFKKSIKYDEYNEMTEVALGKITYYL